MIAGAIIIALVLSCDDPVTIDDRPNDGARRLFDIYDAQIGNPALYPDGFNLAFSYWLGHGENRFRLAVYNTITGDVSDLLVNDEGSYVNVDVSPDGGYIMYGWAWQVYIYTLSDGSVKEVTPNGAMYLPVDWGITDDTVVVREIRNGGATSLLYEIDVATLEMTYLVTSTGGDFYGKFSPNHDRFLATWDYQLNFDNYIEIRMYDTTTWEYEILFENVEFGYVRSGGWSSDGTRVLLVYKPESDEFITVYDLITGDIKYATWTPRDEQNYATTYVFDPFWSVSENKIFYKVGLPNKIWVVDSP